MPINIEIKARSTRHEAIRQWLTEQGADFRGTDRQVDTYFRCEHGRLKLREGNIEHSLIHYHRPDQAGPKRAEVTLYHPPQPAPGLKAILTQAMGVWKVVDKSREIYFIDNVKFHLDAVEGLGTFVEIEAIDRDGSIGEARLQQQCEHYLAQFQIQPADLVERSYSDLVGG
jgi:predicted adenylyl cyclase CyaB